MNVYVNSPGASRHDASPPPSATVPSSHPITAPPLVYLELTTTETQLQRRYRIHRSNGGQPRRLPVDSDWAGLRERLRRWNTVGTSVSQDSAFGDDLYQALFGPAGNRAASQIAAAAWQRRPDHPRHRPLQLRIVTDDPLLAGLPWQQTRCDGALLVKDGWSFALAQAIDECRADLTCRLPGRVLAFIPNGDAPEQASLQHHRIDTCLGNLWSDKGEGHVLHSRRVRQWPPTEPPGDAPCLLYVETHGRVWRDLLQLQDGNGQWLYPGDLISEPGRPWIMFLNLQVKDGEDAKPARIKGLAEDYPLLIVQRHLRGQRSDAAYRALQWLRAIMCQKHPVESAHHELLVTTAIHAGFHHWRPQYHDGAPVLSDHERARLRLDRSRQRSKIKDEVDRMMDSHDTRVVATFAYGVDGNQPELFAEQIRETLLQHGLKPQIQSRIVHQPDDEAVTDASLNSAFYDALDAADPNEPLANVLSAKRPPRRPGGAHNTLLLFHWRRGEGVWDQGARAAWERFCRKTLTQVCPPDLSILAVLPFAIENNKLIDLASEVKLLRQQDRKRRDYRLVPLPPLDRVDNDEVHTFLLEEMDKSFGDDLLADLPDLIILEASKGESRDEAPFDVTAKVLQRGFDLGWDTLRDELQQRWKANI